VEKAGGKQAGAKEAGAKIWIEPKSSDDSAAERWKSATTKREIAS
jgi:hypothetical protein